MKRILSMLLAVVLVLCSVAGLSQPAFAAPVNVQNYGDYTFTKVSNPTTGTKQPDGINTNDLTGFPANRLNSYAWAVTSRGNNIYIGTNRTLFGSAANAVAETIQQSNPNAKQDMIVNLVTLLSGGDVPVKLEEKDYIPQIIKYDTISGTTEVIYQPRTVVGDDGRLYYTDKDGAIVPGADVSSETASFRSVIQFNGNMYFGSLGTNMLQLVRVDENDHAEVVFQTVGLISSLRACAAYDAGEGETIYFGGQDTTYMKWRKWRMEHQGEPYPLPIVIRYLDPATAGSDAEDWSGLVADYSDFGKYAYASVYANGGGNVWDLCSYNGKLYLILAYDGGWALFRGEKGGDSPNAFGWTWTEIVGDNGKYPLAMNAEVAELNEKYRADYNCTKYLGTLTNSGLLESTATPYVYNGKMYIGSFDNATAVQSQTVNKILVKLNCLKTASETGDLGPTLTQIFAPIYQVLSHPQHMWVMDENETIKPVEGANELLDGTTIDYVWRYIEHDGKLYTGTFDSATAYIYYVDFSKERILSILQDVKEQLPPYLQALLNGSFSKTLNTLYKAAKKSLKKVDNKTLLLVGAALAAAASLERFLSGDEEVDKLYADMSALASAKEKLAGEEVAGTYNFPVLKAVKKFLSMVDWMLTLADVEGLEYIVKARNLAKNTAQGFDILVTEDGQNWKRIVDNGLNDPYNYGARTFTICNDELYVGTANPYYGAQLWKITDNAVKAPAAVVTKPTARTGLTYKTGAQKLVNAGKAEGGTIVYALADNPDAVAEEDWKAEIPTATNAGAYTVSWKVQGDAKHLDAAGGTLKVTIGKADATIRIKTSSMTYSVAELKEGAKSFRIQPSADSKGKLSAKIAKYYNKASQKYLSFNVKNGAVTVQKGTPKGTYAVRVTITSKATANYKAGSRTKYIKVVVQ